jgi:hypothetical protein
MDLVLVSCRRITTFPIAFVEEAVFSPSYIFGPFVKNKVGMVVWIHIRVLCRKTFTTGAAGVRKMWQDILVSMYREGLNFTKLGWAVSILIKDVLV